MGGGNGPLIGGGGQGFIQKFWQGGIEKIDQNFTLQQVAFKLRQVIFKLRQVIFKLRQVAFKLRQVTFKLRQVAIKQWQVALFGRFVL